MRLTRQALVLTLALGPLATPVVATDDATTPDLLPGVELVTEEIEPGVYRVDRDGVRDVQGRDMMVSARGDVWLLRGGTGDWSVVRLGEPGVSLMLTDGRNRRLSLRQDREGAPLVASWRIGGDVRAQVFDGTAWVRADASDPACPADAAPESVTIMPDGPCWGPGRNRFEDGRWRLVPGAELGLADDEWIDANAVGPDGSGWVSVRPVDTDDVPLRFGGLLRYDGVTWTRVPFTSPGGLDAGPAFTSEMAVAPDGTVWVVELSLGRNPASVRVRSWDGTTWSGYGPITRPPYPTSAGSSEPRGIHFNADGSIWFMDGWLYFDGETLHPFDLDAVRPVRYQDPTSRSKKGFDSRGRVWVLAPDRRLLVITPEAVAGTK